MEEKYIPKDARWIMENSGIVIEVTFKNTEPIEVIINNKNYGLQKERKDDNYIYKIKVPYNVYDDIINSLIYYIEYDEGVKTCFLINKFILKDEMFIQCNFGRNIYISYKYEESSVYPE